MHYESVWAGNWKLSAENSMEYYHHVGLHKNTVRYRCQRARLARLRPRLIVFHAPRCGMDDKYLSDTR
ncbi:MAG: hypothetical protein Ct9H300mP16_05050 [Pseudomonadota bacterium]|nr:MAG: hypothetical protein Ct9H300mP16_05050 [Pseudomonadota bacterium]